MIHVRLPDGATRPLAPASTAADLAASIGLSLARRTVAAVVDGQLADLSAALPDGAAVKLLPRGDPRALELIRHDLPLKLAEFGKVHRYEPSGALHGLAQYLCNVVEGVDLCDGGHQAALACVAPSSGAAARQAG